MATSPAVAQPLPPQAAARSGGPNGQAPGPTSPAIVAPDRRGAQSAAYGVPQHHDQPGKAADVAGPESCSFATCVLPTLVFLSFFGNFVYSEISLRIAEYDTFFTGPSGTLVFWVFVYLLEFAFVLYQLFFPRPRNSNLIQKKLAIPFILHQVVNILWLVALNQDRMYAATLATSVFWLITLLNFSIVAIEFRLGSYRFYSITDYCLIEVPFAVLLGWETMTLIQNWNIFFVKLGMDGLLNESDAVSAQVCMLILSFALVVTAAILFAGLPMLMDPFVHIPLLWGVSTISWRWLRMGYQRAPHLLWASDAVAEGVGLAAGVIALITLLFFLVAAALLGSSRLWMGFDEDVLDTSSSTTSHPSSPRGGSQQRSSELLV